MSIKVLEQAVKRYKTKAEVARRLGISPQRLNNWFKSGAVPAGWDWNLSERLKK